MGKGAGDNCRGAMQLSGADHQFIPAGFDVFAAQPDLEALAGGTPRLYQPPATADEELDRLFKRIKSQGFYDESAALDFYLACPISKGAQRVPLYELEQLAPIIQAHPDCVVSVSDVHGDVQMLRASLTRLGLLDAAGNRINRDCTLLQMGDLLDGRNAGDYDCMVQGEQWFDVLLAGNHEAAMMGGGSFDGQPVTPPEIKDVLRRLTSPYDLRLQAAFSKHGVFYSHAGLNHNGLSAEDPQAAAQLVNEEWEMFLARSSHQPTSLFGVPKARKGLAPYGGVLWQHWGNLARDTNPHQFRQVVGHSPLGGMETDLTQRVFASDTGGKRLGMTVTLPDGRMVFGSSLVP